MNPNAAPTVDADAEMPEGEGVYPPPAEDTAPQAEGARFGERMRLSDEQYYARVLPRYYIPSDEKVTEATEGGLELVTILLNANTGDAIQIPSATGGEVRNAVREARKKLSGTALQSGYRDIHAKAIETIYAELPEDARGDFANGALELRYTTICRRPDECSRAKKEIGAHTFPEESAIATAAEMIDFADTPWEAMLGEEPFVLEGATDASSVNAPKESSRGGKGVHGGQKIIANDLQKFRYTLGRAMASGDKESWNALSKEYIALMDHLPQYWEYRLAVQDLLARVRDGSIEQMPENILSVASGPHVEAQAHMDLEYLYDANNIPKPEIVNIDLSANMLRRGEDKLEEQAVRLAKKDYWSVPLNVVGDMRTLPIKDGAFAMVECSSLDNLFARAPEHIDMAVTEMIRVLREGGLLRIVHKEGLPESFYAKLTANGFTLLTAPHTTFHARPDFLERVGEARGKKFLERSKQKIFRGAEYLLARKDAVSRPEAETFSAEDIVTAPTSARRDVASDPEKALRLKESLEYFLGMEGGAQLFKTHNRRSRKQQHVPYKALRQAIVRSLAKSVVDETGDAVVMQGGKPVAARKKLAHYADKEVSDPSGVLQLGEIALLDLPYREALLRQYAPFIYKELSDAGIVGNHAPSA